MLFAECATETEELYKMHRHAITDTVHEVLKKLVRNKSLLKHSSHAVKLRLDAAKHYFYHFLFLFPGPKGGKNDRAVSEG